MGKIRELIKSFINPIEPPKSFRELAVAAGIPPKYIEELETSMKYGENYKFDVGIEENKKPRKPRISSNQPPIQSKPKNIVSEKGFDR